ncbi:MAG: phosphoribosylglycinamide formyltransferase [Candidatus Omnitrophica bacterium]|nr:phosphoribosylglycinamide formyltransferase [Candidatus Omnitrophota bacterium]
MNIAVLASGNGTNFETIAKAIKKGYIKANLKVLITDREDAFVRVRARRFKIKEIFINPKNFKTRLDFDNQIIKILKNEKVDLVILAGYMRILTANFVKTFKNKILNIHPALLPAFKGVDAIKRAYNYGCKITGVTIHFVDEKIDHGPIIFQEAIKIKDTDTLEKLEERIHDLEHKLYPKAIKLFVEKRLKIKNRWVYIKNKN